MTISRDSWLLWLGIAGAIVTYLVASENPVQWHYDDWMKFVALLIGIISGKLATSPLAGANDASKVNVSNIGKPMLLLLLLPGLLVGCAPSFKAKLQQADRSVQGALYTLDQTENELYKAGQVSAEFHKSFSKQMVTALTVGQTFHRSVATYKVGQPIPVDVIQLAGALQSAADLVRSLPPSEAKSKIAAVLDAAAFVARDLLVLILPPPTVSTLFPVPLFAH